MKLSRWLGDLMLSTITWASVGMLGLSSMARRALSRMLSTVARKESGSAGAS